VMPIIEAIRRVTIITLPTFPRVPPKFIFIS